MASLIMPPLMASLIMPPPDGLSHHGPPPSGENALSDFVQKRWALKAPDSALGNVLALGVTNLDPLYGNVLGLGVTNLEPLYVIVLKSYLHHFLPLGISAERDARKRECEELRQSPLSGALRADAELLLHSLSQFWLAQNGEPHLIKQLSLRPPATESELTNYAVLGCLPCLFDHLNAHELQMARRYRHDCL
jgi:hypothetical protein